MQRELKISQILKDGDGRVILDINGEWYEYEFSEIWEYENIVKYYGRNKGRFLQHMKKFYKGKYKNAQ